MRLVVALIAVLAMVSTASATNDVWFVNGANGAEGTTLNLAAPGTYTIGVWMKTTETCWGFEAALRGAGQSATGLTVTAPSGGGVSGWAVSASVAGSGNGLLDAACQSTGTAYTGSYQFATFTLTAVAGDIYGGVPTGTNGWYTEESGYPLVTMGPTGATVVSDGLADSFATLPAIHVAPEPATLVLLGFGLVGLLRRR